jgi:proteic killer suppression protein
MGRHRVVLAPSVGRALPRLPQHIRRKLAAWVAAVEAQGLEEIRRLRGYHDEPLAGPRAGQRSIRLSRSYRAIYSVQADAVIRVEEVTKHAY